MLQLTPSWNCCRAPYAQTVSAGPPLMNDMASCYRLQAPYHPPLPLVAPPSHAPTAYTLSTCHRHMRRREEEGRAGVSTQAGDEHCKGTADAGTGGYAVRFLQAYH